MEAGTLPKNENIEILYLIILLNNKNSFRYGGHGLIYIFLNDSSGPQLRIRFTKSYFKPKHEKSIDIENLFIE